MKNAEKTGKMVTGALMICLIVLLTALFKIPIPMTQGYIHLGDVAVFMSLLVLGLKKGAVCAGFGSALADLFCGMAIFAPFSFIVKGISIFFAGYMLEHSKGNITKGRIIAAITIYTVFMTAGYFVAEWIIYGTWAVALIGILWNIGQGLAGGILAVLLSSYLCKTSAKKVYTYIVK